VGKKLRQKEKEKEKSPSRWSREGGKRSYCWAKDKGEIEGWLKGVVIAGGRNGNIVLHRKERRRRSLSRGKEFLCDQEKRGVWGSVGFRIAVEAPIRHELESGGRKKRDITKVRAMAVIVERKRGLRKDLSLKIQRGRRKKFTKGRRGQKKPGKASCLVQKEKERKRDEGFLGVIRRELSC